MITERRELTEEQKIKFVDDVFENEQLRNKMLYDFGFEVRKYEEEDLMYIIYSVMEHGGLLDQVKAAKAIYIVDSIAKFVCSRDEMVVDEIGSFTMDLLSDCEVVHFEKNE